jgi:hypothetical protein
MKRVSTLLLSTLLLFGVSSCGILGIGGDTVEVRKPRLHKTWPKKHKWHKKLKVWKYTVQMPERGGAKKVKMRN